MWDVLCSNLCFYFNIPFRRMRSTLSSNSQDMPMTFKSALPSSTDGSTNKPMTNDGYVEYKPQKEDEYQDVNPGPVLKTPGSDTTTHVYATSMDPPIGKDTMGDDYEDLHNYETP